MKVTINLHRAQRHVIANRKRFNVLACGRRWGKSRLAFALAAETMAQHGISAYACPAASDYEKRWKEAIEFFAPVLAQAHVSDGVLEFRNGARMEWFGLHRDVNIRGNKYHRFILDECAFAPNLEGAWIQVVRPTLTDYRGDAYFMSTPDGFNYFKTLFDRAQVSSKWKSFQMPTSSNPFIAADEIAEARDEMPSVGFAQEYLAQFVDLSGARVKREWLQYGPAPDGVTYSMGVDLAASQSTHADYTAIVVTAHNGNGKYWVVDVWRGRWMFNDIMANIIACAAKWRPGIIAVEQVQAQAYVVQELVRTTLLPVSPVTPDRDKVRRFMPVEGKIEHGHVAIAPGIDAAFEQELLSFPHGTHDDTVDAFVYSMLGHEQSYSIISL